MLWIDRVFSLAYQATKMPARATVKNALETKTARTTPLMAPKAALGSSLRRRAAAKRFERFTCRRMST